jgi:hypothetical protein
LEAILELNDFFADGLVPWTDLTSAISDAVQSGDNRVFWEGLRVPQNPGYGFQRVGDALRDRCHLLRDIYGNPFRPVT